MHVQTCLATAPTPPASSPRPETTAWASQVGLRPGWPSRGPCLRAPPACSAPSGRCTVCQQGCPRPALAVFVRPCTGPLRPRAPSPLGQVHWDVLRCHPMSTTPVQFVWFRSQAWPGTPPSWCAPWRAPTATSTPAPSWTASPCARRCVPAGQGQGLRCVWGSRQSTCRWSTAAVAVPAVPEALGAGQGSVGRAGGAAAGGSAAGGRAATAVRHAGWPALVLRRRCVGGASIAPNPVPPPLCRRVRESTRTRITQTVKAATQRPASLRWARHAPLAPLLPPPLRWRRRRRQRSDARDFTSRAGRRQRQST